MKSSPLSFKLIFYLTLLLSSILLTTPAWSTSAQSGGATATPTMTATPTTTATTPPAQLTITAVQPNSVSSSSDTELIITGTGFLDGVAVVLSGSGGLATTFVSSNLLRANLPAGTAVGIYSLTVINPNAQSTTLNNALTVTAPIAETATPHPTDTPAPTAFVRPLLVVNSYGASSAEITPNSNLDFEMTIGNAGAIQASNIVATFISGDFVARNTGSIRALGTLDSGAANRFWQPLYATSGLPSGGIATLQVKVDYTDSNGTAYSDTFNLTFPVVRAAVGGPAPTATATPTETPTPTPTVTPTTGPRLRPQLIVTGYDTGAAQLQPGLTFTLSLMVQNQGNADAERVTMIVGGGTASGGAVDGTPTAGGVAGAGGEFSKFAPVGASNVQTLGDLAMGSSLQATMAFIVNAATEAGAYPVKVSFVYEDAQNGDFVDDQVITLLVVKRPSVAMNFYSPAPPFFAGEPGSLPLQIVNTGSRTASLGSFTVSSSDGSTIENGSVFVGNLEPGGFYPLDALIFPAAEGSQTLVLTINYTDDFGQAQSISQTVEIEVLPPFIFEPPIEGFPEEVPPPESEPETTWQKVWRFILGLIGLSSGLPQPQVDNGLGPGNFEPSGFESGINPPAVEVEIRP